MISCHPRVTAPVGGSRSGRGLMDRARLNQLEDSDFGREMHTVGSLHVEGSRHRPEGRRQGTSRGVFKALSGLECRLLSHHPGAVDFLDMARAVDDGPMPVQQLDGFSTLVRDLDGVEKEPAARWRAAVFRRVARTNDDAHPARLGFRGRFKEIGVTHTFHSSSRGVEAERMPPL